MKKLCKHCSWLFDSDGDEILCSNCASWSFFYGHYIFEEEKDDERSEKRGQDDGPGQADGV